MQRTKRNEINYCTTQLLDRDLVCFLAAGGRPPGMLIDVKSSAASSAADVAPTLDLFRCISSCVSSKDLGLARLEWLWPLRMLAELAVVLVLFTD
jgi:hypothetical protein